VLRLVFWYLGKRRGSLPRLLLAVFAPSKTAACPHAAGGGTIVEEAEETAWGSGWACAGAVPGGDEWDVDGVWGAADGGANAMCRAADSDAWSASASAHSNVIADSNAVADECS
jgi:hypothetical protein